MEVEKENEETLCIDRGVVERPGWLVKGRDSWLESKELLNGAYETSRPGSWKLALGVVEPVNMIGTGMLPELEVLRAIGTGEGSVTNAFVERE